MYVYTVSVCVYMRVECVCRCEGECESVCCTQKQEINECNHHMCMFKKHKVAFCKVHVLYTRLYRV